MKRICKYCGAGYDGDPGSTACPECVKKLRSSTIRDRICRACGITFPGGPRAWYCPECRADRKREADRRHKRSGPSRKIGSTDICQICGNPYTVASGLQKYCPDCAPDVVRSIDREQSRAWAAEHLSPQQRREQRQACTAPHLCVVCGKPFLPDDASHTCSKACQAIYARWRASKWEKAHREYRNQYRRELYRNKKEDNHDD